VPSAADSSTSPSRDIFISIIVIPLFDDHYVEGLIQLGDSFLDDHVLRRIQLGPFHKNNNLVWACRAVMWQLYCSQSSFGVGQIPCLSLQFGLSQALNRKRVLAVRRIRDQYGEPYSTVVFTLYGAAPVRISSSYVSRCVSYSNGSSFPFNDTNELVIAGDNNKLTFYH
ncbi:hypothetical protein LCGC14_3039370, partial [marine sediment metagenome]